MSFRGCQKQQRGAAGVEDLVGDLLCTGLFAICCFAPQAQSLCAPVQGSLSTTAARPPQRRFIDYAKMAFCHWTSVARESGATPALLLPFRSTTQVCSCAGIGERESRTFGSDCVTLRVAFPWVRSLNLASTARCSSDTDVAVARWMDSLRLTVLAIGTRIEAGRTLNRSHAFWTCLDATGSRALLRKWRSGKTKASEAAGFDRCCHFDR